MQNWRTLPHMKSSIWMGLMFLLVLGRIAPAHAQQPATSAPDKTEREERFVLNNSWLGPVGGFHVVDAGSAPKGTFRLQLGVDFFSTSDFLIVGDQHDHVGGSLSLSWTPLSFLELSAAFLGVSNTNSQSDPELFQVIGDVNLDVKAFHNILPWLIVGGDFGATLLNSVGDIGVDLAATSLALRANASTDFRRLRHPIPLLARLGVQYQLDNSSKLIDGVEESRFNTLPDAPADPQFESRHLVSAVERYSLAINRTDRINVSLGVEAPLTVAKNFVISPIAEWQLGIPVNRQGYTCLFVSEPGSSSTSAAGEDSCLQKRGFAAYPMVLSLGAKFLPPVRGLAVFAGIDIGLQGTSKFVRELAPVAPYSVLAGISYAYDTKRPEPVVIERSLASQSQVTKVGKLSGMVEAQDTHAGVGRAEIHFAGTNLNPMLTDNSGRFTSYPLPPGPVRLEIRAPGYETSTCLAEIPEHPQDVIVRCQLKAVSVLENATVHVVDDKDVPVAGARVLFMGAGARGTASPLVPEVQTDAQGDATVTLKPGEYVLRVDSPEYLLRQKSVSVPAEQKLAIKAVLTLKPKTPLVRVLNDKLVLGRQIHFEPGKAEISLDSTQLMEAIADILLRNPAIIRVEIQGHTDNTGSAELNKTLSERRAQAVRTWLIDEAGVDGDRLIARGFGLEQPLVPNITPANRAQNRRVQFVILERAPNAAPDADSKAVAP